MSALQAPSTPPTVLALSGGIGGAKLALGLYRVLAPWELAVAINTGDDFTHLGLHIAPDVDTVMYTLAGENNTELGWGRIGESWNFMQQFSRLGGEDWFNLGDGDLAVHMRRRQLLDDGLGLGAITSRFYASFGIQAHAWPASDDPVRTMIATADGRRLPFQNYFVGEKCAPEVRGFSYVGADHASPNAELIAALNDGNLRAVVICPSNPFVSINPILAIPGVRDALRSCRAPVVAVSPIVGGAAIKGPLVKMMTELGQSANARSVFDNYRDFLSGAVIDSVDMDLAESLDVPAFVAPTVMKDITDRENLARAVLDFADGLSIDVRETG